MGDFSDNFLGIDDEFHGDGEGGSTRPLDTLVENMVDSSTRWLVRRQHLAPQTFAGEDRVYASIVGAMAVACVPMYLTPATTTITCDVAGIISSTTRESEGGTSTLRMRVRVQGQDPGSITSYTGDGTVQHYTVAKDVSVPRSGWRLIMLEISSTDDGLVDGTTSWDGTDNGYFLLGDGTDNAEEGEYVATDFASWQPMAEVDHQETAYTSGSTSPSHPLMITPRTTRMLSTEASDLSIRSMSYLKPRSIFWSTEVSDETTTSTYTAKPKDEMLPGSTVYGQHTTKHQSNISGTYTRNEVIAAGPQMIESPNATWGSKYARWTTVYANGGANQAFGNLSCQLNRDVGTLRIGMYVLFYHVGSGPESTVVRPEESLNLATKMSWEIAATLEQVGSGDTWGSVSSIAKTAVTTEKNDTPHYVSSYGSSVPLLNQVYYEYYHQDANGSDGYMWYEGALMPNYGDLAILKPIIMEIDYNKDDADTFSNPVRVTLEASPDDGDISYEMGADEQDKDRIAAKLICMGISEQGDA